MLQLEDELLKRERVVSWALGWVDAGPIGPPFGLGLAIEYLSQLPSKLLYIKRGNVSIEIK
jgi:hypothetical protein